MSQDFIIRTAVASDLPFIFSTWLRNYLHSNTGFTREMDREIYYEFHNLVVKRIIDRGASILVAADRQQPEVIYGYLVWEAPPAAKIVHYAYVKKAFRRLGIFSEMAKKAELGSSLLMYTHQTEIGKKLSEKYKKEREWQVKYCPYLV